LPVEAREAFVAGTGRRASEIGLEQSCSAPREAAVPAGRPASFTP
jgi:hypothetical protein